MADGGREMSPRERGDLFWIIAVMCLVCLAIVVAAALYGV
jgi:hypothetical protein